MPVSVIKNAVSFARKWRDERQLPDSAKEEREADHAFRLREDPGPTAVIAAGLEWLGRAQDRSKTQDGGAARHFSLVDGWAASYPETSGYIVPTLIDGAEDQDSSELRSRAIRMLDWLVSIQFPEGGFQGGTVDALPRVPVTFNTGQILLGLAAGASRIDRSRYLAPMQRAAEWLINSQDADGCWRKHPTPFAQAGEKAYETHVSWGLFEAARVDPDRGFGEAGLKQVRWALTNQRENGWFAQCCLSDPQRPLTHTLGYVLRGVLEAHLWSGDSDLLAAARKTADGLATALGADGRLPGRLDRNWSAGAPWVCLTGSVQIAHCWLILHELTRDERYLAAARQANAFVRRTVAMDGPDDRRGAVKGSFPVDGDYGRYEYLNWACKFMIDSNRMELRSRPA